MHGRYCLGELAQLLPLVEFVLLVQPGGGGGGTVRPNGAQGEGTRYVRLVCVGVCVVRVELTELTEVFAHGFTILTNLTIILVPIVILILLILLIQIMLHVIFVSTHCN